MAPAAELQRKKETTGTRTSTYRNSPNASVMQSVSIPPSKFKHVHLLD
jgi:hypothetical protein